MTSLSTTTLARIAIALVGVTLAWLLVGFDLGSAAILLGVLVTAALVAETAWVPSRAAQPASTNAALGNAADILDGFSDAAFAYDGLFRITYANDAALELLGMTRAEVADFVITPQLAQKDSRFTRLVQIVYPSLAPLVAPQESRGSTQVVDLTFNSPELHFRVSTVTLPDNRGFLKIVRDRTRQVEIVRSKGEFVTVASHQLRTPLTEISWALETLAGSTTMQPDDQALAAQTLDSVKSLITTAEDLLGVAKIEEGRFGYRFAQTDIVALLNEQLGKALPIVEKAGLKLFFDRPASALPPVYIDTDKIAMVLNNLVENAMRYNVAGGEITVKAEALSDEPFVKVSVRDTGIGIAPRDVDKLFTKFFRAENAVKAVAGGTGLGLYIASNIVRAHGGQMGVGSELGRGSTFWFTLATDERRVPQREVGEEV